MEDTADCIVCDLYLHLCTLVLYRMGSALLSRFDVVFLLLDIPDESHDRQLSEHVMANRSGRGRTSSATVARNNTELQTSILLEHSDMPLSERLQVKMRCLLSARTDHNDITKKQLFSGIKCIFF